MRRRHVAILGFLAAACAWWPGCRASEVPAPRPAATAPTPAVTGVAPAAATPVSAALGGGAVPPAATFVGSAVCVGCHTEAAASWRGSQHAAAMQPATPATVLGDFANARATAGGVTSTFVRRGDDFVVRTDGPGGTLADYRVAWTFGVFPLQQYLVDFPDGRKQALPLAWDARPKAQGGQRWFHLYPHETIDHRDPLHWTRLQQNWNFVCADCHSTNLRRNYDAAADRFATTWSDVAVACEACHGPGSNHVAWAEHRAGSEAWPAHGLAIALDERAGVTWTPSATAPVRSRPLATRREVETCAVCHARRRPLGIDSNPTGRLLDTHIPALLEPGLYEPDGQQHDEVYTWGSFVQSKMYARGVTCSDCHEPHAGKLRAAGNAVCTPCHVAATYDVAAHHRHAEGSAATACVACHMPTRTYMVVDPRHDHSLRVPRPDLSVADGTPNACTGCHAEHDAAWAAAAVAEWYGPVRKGFQTYGAALRAGRDGAPGAAARLAALVGDRGAPEIARATAAAMLERQASPATLPALRAALADASALVRVGALDAVRALPPEARAALASPLAGDTVKAVRVEAGRALASVPFEALPPAAAAASRRAVDEWAASEHAVAERPESHLNLGIVAAERGDAAAAEAEYRAALRIDPLFVPAYVNLADLHRTTGRAGDAAAALDEGLAAVPDDPTLLHALGLQRVREGRSDDALALLGRAATARPDDARFAYVYGVALHSAGRSAEATAVLTAALARAPYDPALLSALAAFERDAGRREAALDYARRLAAVAPEGESVRAMIRELGGE
ncbi:MAG: tetratricopeptide repeat protein [Deltaproteobacteria bacterium]|nr:tetratricopeptide repeat protein [Deltaproteobacteria bacterium]